MQLSGRDLLMTPNKSAFCCWLEEINTYITSGEMVNVLLCRSVVNCA